VWSLPHAPVIFSCKAALNVGQCEQRSALKMAMSHGNVFILSITNGQ